jgi:RNA polymerase sigma factor (sigma-70 family)
MTVTEGHWRKLKSSQIGEGKFGEPVYGKTWVDRKEAPKSKSPASEISNKKDISSIVDEKIKKYSPRSEKDEEDMRLWFRWKETGSEEDLEALLDRFQGAVGAEAKRWYAAPIPRSALFATANRNLVKAFNRFDPENSKGATLNTFASYYVKKMSDTVYKYQNVGRIPQNRITKIKGFQEAEEILRTELGREPSLQALATELGWSLAETERMKSEMRRDLIASKNLNEDTLDGTSEAGEEAMAVRIIYSELDEIEKGVMEYTLGIHGKDEMSAGDIAKKLNISRPKVSRVRSKIDLMLKERGV